jgi:PPOX class probable F420-dependent enzyme
MLAYLEAYADARDLTRHISFGAPVERIQRGDGGWEVIAGEAAPQRFDWVVVASGHYSDPAMPKLQGEFSGTLMHVRDYRTPDRFAGQRVVVVGGAQSAVDIATEISSTAAQTILACDQVHHLLPRHIIGRPYDGFDSASALLLPLPIVRLTMQAMLRVARAAPKRGSLPPARHRLFETRWPAVVSPAVEAAISAHALESRPHVRALAGEEVVFSDGNVQPADAIVFATGYRINFPFLPSELGCGGGWEFPLYRRILSPHAPGLAFIGMIEPGPGLFEIVEHQSQWLAEVLAGRLPIPDDRAMWQAIDAGGERRSRRQFAATGPHTILCNRHAYLRVLARDLRRARRGARPIGRDRGGVSGARPTARPRLGRRLPGAVPSARAQAQMLRSAASEVARAHAVGTLEELARRRHSLVVTFRRDGTPVATPVWAAVADGRVYARTERGSGKVKRLLHDSRALVAPCTARGRQLGPPLPMRGRVLAAREEDIAEGALANRYGLLRALFERTMDLIRVEMCYLELTPDDAARADERLGPSPGVSESPTV